MNDGPMLNDEQMAALRHCSKNGHVWRERSGPTDQVCSCCGWPRNMVSSTAGGWAFSELQDAILCIHDLAAGTFIQSPEERLRRIAVRCEKIIDSDPAMKAILGRDKKETP